MNALMHGKVHLSKLTSWHSFFLPICLFFIFATNLLIDSRSSKLRLVFFLFFFLISKISMRAAILSLCSCLCWFENPILLLGYQNQFVIECGIIAIIFVNFLNGNEINLSEKLQNKTSPDFFYHPLVIPGIFAVFNCAFAFSVQIGEIASLSVKGLNPVDIARGFIVRSLDWDVSITNFYHPICLVFAFLIHLKFLQIVFNRWRELKISYENIFASMILGSIPIFIYAISQIYRIVPIRHTRLIGGSFQNGNHLSFYSGIIILLALYMVSIRKSIWGVFAILALPFFLIGGSKTSWISMAVAAGSFMVMRLVDSLASSHSKNSPWKMLLSRQTGFFCLAIVGSFAYNWASRDFSILTNIWKRDRDKVSNYFFRFIETGSVDFLWSGGRLEHLKFALESISNFPFFGRGLGNFFVLSNSGYELHYPYLTWLFAMGIPGAVFFVLGILIFVRFAVVRIVKNFAGNNKTDNGGVVLLTICVYLFFSHTLDTFISYRSFLYLISTIFVVVVKSACEDQTGIKASSAPRYIAIAALLGGMIAGSLTWNFPHSRVAHIITSVQQSGVKNKENMTQFRLNSPYKTVVQKQECRHFQLHHDGIISKDPLRLEIFETRSEPPQFFNFTSAYRWQRKNMRFVETVLIWPKQWNNICVCNQSHESSFLESPHQLTAYDKVINKKAIWLQGAEGRFENLDQNSTTSQVSFKNFLVIDQGSTVFRVDRFPKMVCHAMVTI